MSRIVHAVADTVPPDFRGPLERHRAGCLKCQAEEVRRRFQQKTGHFPQSATTSDDQAAPLACSMID